MHWSFQTGLDWLFSPDSKWLISPDANSGVCTTANISRFQWQGLKPAPMRPIDPRIYLQLRVIKQAMT